MGTSRSGKHAYPEAGRHGDNDQNGAIMHRFMRLVLVLAVVLAMGTLEALAASANQFHSSASNTTLTVASNSSQKYLYDAGGRTVECTKVAGVGEVTSQTLAEVTFHPEYSTCTVEGIFGSSAEVKMNECDYRFTIEGTKNEGPVHVACSETSQITITVKVLGVSICTYHIGKQTPKGNAIYTNNGTKQVGVQVNLSGITGMRQGSSECGAATSTQGNYQGSAAVKGEKTGTQEEVAVQVG